MPKIPLRPISKEAHISDFRLATPRLSDKGVATARPTRTVAPKEKILSQILGDVSKASGDIAEYFASKEETIRVANSQHLQTDINDIFREIKVADSTRTSGQAVGMLGELREREEELRTSSIPEELDAKTTQELNSKFDSLFNRHAEWTANWVVQQSDVADKEARMRTIQNAHQNIASLTIGDSVGVEQEVEDALKFELERNPNLTEDQLETNRRAFREDFTSFALVKWISDSPIAAVDFWDKNQERMKKALPKMYNQINSKIEVAREDADFDMADQVLRRLYKDNYLSMAFDVEKNYKNYNLSAKQGLYLASNYRTIHNFNATETERIRQKKENTFFVDSDTKYRDPETGILDAQGYLYALEQAFRTGIVDDSSYRAARNQLLHGEFNMDRYHELMDAIQGGLITTKGQINLAILGQGVKPEPFYTELAKQKKDEEQGWVTNYFDEAALKYDREARKKKVSELDIKEKELIIDPALRPDFIRHLQQRARELGYSPGDSRVLDEANKLLQSGWYDGFDIREIEDVPEDEFFEGKAPWNIFGEKYGRRWQHEIATGGSPVDRTDPWASKAYEELTGRGKAITPESVRRTIEYLKGQENAK